jgi:hypothetical protein
MVGLAAPTLALRGAGVNNRPYGTVKEPKALSGRSLRPPRLVVGDGHLGIWGALTAVFPLARPQRAGTIGS